MANRGRLRLATVVSPEYLENPFPETGTEIHAPPVPSCFRLPSPVLSAPSLPCPRPSKLISVLTKNTRAKCKIFLRFFHKGQEKSRHYPVFPEYNRLLIKNRRAVSLFWLIPSHGQVFLPGFEYLLQALRLKIVYTL